MDAAPSNRRFAQDLGLTFPLLSDMKREVSKRYGILRDDRNIAMRTTFVVDKGGIVRQIQQGSEAIDPTGASLMCSRLHGEG